MHASVTSLEQRLPGTQSEPAGVPNVHTVNRVRATFTVPDASIVPVNTSCANVMTSFASEKSKGYGGPTTEPPSKVKAPVAASIVTSAETGDDRSTGKLMSTGAIE